MSALPHHARQHWPALLVLAMAAVVAFAATWSDELADLGGDSALYVLSARHFAPYLPADPIAAEFAADSQFPPLYPLLLAFTGGAADLHLAHAATTACLLAAFAATYAFALAVGLPRWLALVTTVLFAAMPGTIPPALQLKSEPLYLALSLWGLVLLLRANGSNRPGDYWLAAALFAAAMLTRSVGIALLPALVIALARQRPRGWWLMPVVMLLPSILWGLSRPDDVYGGVLMRYASVPLATIAAQFQFYGLAFAWGLAGNLLQTQALATVLVPLGLLALAVLAVRFLRWQPDAWYVAAYLAIMVVWPYPEEGQRLGWVLMPCLLAYATWVAHRVAERWRGHPVAGSAMRASVAASLALLIVPGSYLAVQRWTGAEDPAWRYVPDWYRVQPDMARKKAQIHVDMMRGIVDLGAMVPEGSCIHAIKPQVVAVLAHREARAPPVERATNAEFDAWLARRECRYFMFLSATDGQGIRTVFYPLERLGKRVEVLALRTTDPAEDASQVVAALAKLVD